MSYGDHRGKLYWFDWDTLRKTILGLVPHIALLLGLFMSHVNGLLRYGYPLIAATPLICAYTYYAVTQPHMAQTDVLPEEDKTRTVRFVKKGKNSLKRALGNTVQSEKNIIRKLCYSVLRRLDHSEKNAPPEE